MADNTFDTGSDHVRLDVADGVAVLRVDRPKMNPLNTEIQLAIGHAARWAAQAEDVAAVVVTGGQKVFAAGADIKEMIDYGSGDMMKLGREIHAAFDDLARLPKPVVAAINGYALGGGFELAMCADWRICADDAKVGQPEVTLGVVPGLGGSQRLTRLVGPSRAKEILFTGRLVEADEAYRIGMVDQVVPADQVQDAALAWAKQFVGGPARAIAACKELVDTGLDGDLASGLALERVHFAALFDSEDKDRGMRAFAAKEKPTFTGR
ncbi:enoyl-CoA hydratase/isomerase family protein [Mariniluteicoccus flavus]